jgi:CDP-glycerol glycerophosphotransferase (TagB/SpsB family)
VSNYSLTSAFQLPVGRCLEFGYPRLDILFGDKEAVISQLRRTKDNEFIALLTHLNSFKRVILYLPTFRDSGEDFLMEAGLDVARIEAICEELDAVFVIKMHQNSPSSSFETKVVTARRILILRSKLDVYPLMVFADLLITDYSSVMFEFILTRKPIVLYAFDLETYVSKCRDLYLPYEELATGVQVETFDELCSALRKLLSGPLKQNYEDGIIERFNRFSDGNASKRICEFVRKIESGKENSD